MTKQVEVITSVQRRRRWSREQKERVVAAMMEPGAVASAVAREADSPVSLRYRWRQQLSEPTCPAPRFAAERLAAEQRMALPSSGAIEVELAGVRLRSVGTVDAATVSAVIDAVMDGRR